MRILLTLILFVGMAAGHTICQDLPDGTVCTEGPDQAPSSGEISISMSKFPGIVLTDELVYEGTGTIDQDFTAYESFFTDERRALNNLLFDLWGMFDKVEDVAFAVVSHGYTVTQNGLVTLNDGSQWQIVMGPGDIIRMEMR